ncbi:MAG: lysophospholipid acyltransferase family protein, partial [Helicobacter sp.]|nr:lysophospholipid acyltransferase family protein [Helicobacter sp.]
MKTLIKRVKRKFFVKAIPICSFIFIKSLGFLCRFEYQISSQTLDFMRSKKPFIVAFWHGELLVQPIMFNYISPKQKVYVLISKHFDGEIISRTMEFFKIFSLRGSSSKGGIKALLMALKKLQQGNLVAITPDGPRGPKHSIADGIILLSQKSNTPIIVSRIHYHNAWMLRTWDSFRIPKPFSKITFIIKDPFLVNDLSLESAKNYIYSKMQENEQKQA